MLCWKKDISLWFFISFSITTPAQAAKLELTILRKAARKLKSSKDWLGSLPNSISAIEVQTRTKAAHCSPEMLCAG